MIALVLGLGAGALIAVLARVVETSRLAFGPYAFFGNGALIVPALGSGLALYALWTWALRTGRPRRDLLAAAAGLFLGLGLSGLLAVPPSLPAIAFTGLLFVAPAALGAYAVLAWSERREAGRPQREAALLTALVGAGTVLTLAPFPPVGVGIISGAFVTVARGAPGSGPLVLGGLLALMLLAAGLALPLLLAGGAP